MNIRLKRQFYFNSLLVYNGQYTINEYNLVVKFITVSDNSEHQNIAYERVKYWIESVIGNSILIHEKSDKIDSLKAAGLRVICLSEEPVDQVIGIMLYSKLNAIMEDVMLVSEIEISSEVGDGMCYIHSSDESAIALTGNDWWTNPKPKWLDTKQKKALNKVIEIDRMPEWPELGLDWDKSEESTHSADVVFADFIKNENK